LFHLLLLLAEKGVPLGKVLAELDRRAAAETGGAT
jgi:phosphoribosyl-ATP pyrophosphohydrolase